MELNGTVLSITFGVTLLLAIGILFIIGHNKSSNFRPSMNSNIDPGLGKLLNLLGSDIDGLLPESFTRNKKRIKKIEKLFVEANNPWKITPHEFIILKVILGFLGGLIGSVVAGMFVYLEMHMIIVVFIVGFPAIMGYITPSIYYSQLAAERVSQFKGQLPEAIDYLIMSLSGGGYSLSVAFEQTLQYLQEGVIKEEFSKIVDDLKTGKTMESALTAFADRAPTEGIKSFSRALINANKMSTDMTEILRSRAENSRRDLEKEIEKRVGTLESRITMVFSPASAISLGIIVIAPAVTSLMTML